MDLKVKVGGKGGATIAVQNKRRYQQPQVKCYGSVKILTAAGGSTGGEEDAGAAPSVILRRATRN